MTVAVIVAEEPSTQDVELRIATEPTAASAGTLRRLSISEIYGSTFQGEGPYTGRPSTFLRLGICNLTCVWCDTPYTWRWSAKLNHQSDVVYDPKKELQLLTVEAVALRLLELPLSRGLVITGGEPLLQQQALVDLIFVLSGRGVFRQAFESIEIETNGTVWPSDELINAGVHFNVSPKLSNAEMSAALRINWDVLKRFCRVPSVAFKFVVCSLSDLYEVHQIVETLGIPNDRVWIMPEGRDTATLDATLGTLVDAIFRAGWNISTRLHIHLFGNRRGT